MKEKTVEKPGWRQPASLEGVQLLDAHSEFGRVGFQAAAGMIGRLGRLCLTGIKRRTGIKRKVLPGIVLMLGLQLSVSAQSASPSLPSSSTATPAGATEPDSTIVQFAGGPPQLRTSSGYQLHQGDKLEVKFFYQPELNQETIVKPDGMISLPLIGDVRAEGLTVSELEQKLTERYAKELIDPLISVTLKEFVKPRIFIGGYVVKPGAYELRDGDMLAQAVLLAGGFTPQAHRKQVIHLRPIGEGQMRVTVVDMTKVYSKRPDPFLNLTLRDGDLIYVPQSKLSRINDALRALQIQSFGLYTDPLRRR
ncbi:MAG: polysaccharide biosynthesis/export family protein [Acidobacteriota bacterium]|nr:polysaccharide export protein [Blastocatellia bacterium]MDW8238456.1 polysaccharide biosynthesis/export family protein [Acidobacteriota bacterium]